LLQVAQVQQAVAVFKLAQMAVAVVRVDFVRP
jgi:hypothetical protein